MYKSWVNYIRADFKFFKFILFLKITLEEPEKMYFQPTIERERERVG
jgi:hypothetical protein